MLEKIATIEARYHELGQLMEENVNDYQKVAELAKERADLEEMVSMSQQYRSILKQIEESRSLIDTDDEEMRQLAEADLEALQPRADALEKSLKAMLVPKDPRDDRDVIVEIRGGTGGDEAALFAGDLFRIYSRYAEKRRWRVEILSQSETGIGGDKENCFCVQGKGGCLRLKLQSGVHRVQRVPVTESSGRIHTSTATVAVLAEVEDVEIDIPDNDVRIDVYRSAGAGGK